MAKALSAVLRITGDKDPEYLDAALHSLRRQLVDAGLVESFRLETSPSPAGAKSSEAITIGALCVAVLPTLIPAVFDLVKTWSAQRAAQKVVFELKEGDASVHLEYHPDQMTPDEIRQLAEVLSGQRES